MERANSPNPAPRFQFSLVNLVPRVEPNYQFPLVIFAGPPVGENAMKANLLENVLLFTCLAAFVTGIAFAAVTLLG